MSDLIKNLQIKNQSNFLIVGLPDDLKELKRDFPKLFNDKPKKFHDFIMVFA